MTAADGTPIGAVDTDEGERGYGWLFFAGTMLGIAGLMRLVDAIWAFRYEGPLPEALQDGLVGEKLDNYAWLWLAVAVVLILSSFLVLSRSQVGRWVGIVAAAIGAITAMTWMPYYPIWALTYVGLAALVIYALARYGSREAY